MRNSTHGKNWREFVALRRFPQGSRKFRRNRPFGSRQPASQVGLKGSWLLAFLGWVQTVVSWLQVVGISLGYRHVSLQASWTTVEEVERSLSLLLGFLRVLCYIRALDSCCVGHLGRVQNVLDWNTTRIKPFSTYVGTEGNFDSPQFVYNKIFLKKLLMKIINHVFRLLLARFASKLVNYSRYRTINFRKNSKLTTFSFVNSHLTIFKHFQRLTVPPITEQFGRKRCQKKRKVVSYQLTLTK